MLTAAAPVKLPSAPVPGQVRDGSLRRQSRGPNGTMVPLQAVTGSGDFCINLLLAEGDFALSEQEVQEVQQGGTKQSERRRGGRTAQCDCFTPPAAVPQQQLQQQQHMSRDQNLCQHMRSSKQKQEHFR